MAQMVKIEDNVSMPNWKELNKVQRCIPFAKIIFFQLGAWIKSYVVQIFWGKASNFGQHVKNIAIYFYDLVSI